MLSSLVRPDVQSAPESDDMESETEPDATQSLFTSHRVTAFDFERIPRRTSQNVWMAPSKSLKSRATKEIGTQCDIDDMLEPMGVNVLNHRMCSRRVRQLPLNPDMEASIVDIHFSSFRDLASVAEWASMLSRHELRELAGGFLGMRIAGVAIKGSARARPRSVVGRFLEEAVLLCKIQNFRNALVSSATMLFFHGFSKKPFNGRNLFALVDHDATLWGPVMHTALDFAGRLTQRGALPKALNAELLQRSAWLLNNEGAQYRTHVVSMVTALKSKPQQRTRVQGLVRAGTAPPALCPKTRSVGTLLHLQDDLAPHCCISFEGVVRDEPYVAPEVIPLDIPIEDLPQYWRFAAGGEHKPAKLEQRAKRAEVMIAWSGLLLRTKGAKNIKMSN